MREIFDWFKIKDMKGEEIEKIREDALKKCKDKKVKLILDREKRGRRGVLRFVDRPFTNGIFTYRIYLETKKLKRYIPTSSIDKIYLI